ncbi:hypothetical protein DYD21_20415 [Rhodohalobacter sp. SW132]|uniref:hypothetical protein n=1 Tax=Rhodohalobacter sp. SW132 TaxID=2293433 RepID=UPI000E28861C|nr:hypothetical protein [Rhodohalobacter sp. SW132]REL23979.1 hypothetical protein DYD21_20415 [Rhodohalobacter sp. SW132]
MLSKRYAIEIFLFLGIIFLTIFSSCAPKGEILQQDHEHGTYHLYVPENYSPDSDVVVIVHGMPGSNENVAERAERYINRWTDFSDTTGAVIIAPVFDQENYASDGGSGFGGYRGLYGRNVGADEFVHQILEEVDTGLAPTSEDRFYLYGFSAGGQFTNRYLVRHPDRLLGVVVGAAGRYAFPDEETSWHYGMGSIQHQSEWHDGEPLEVDITPDPQGWVQATQLPVTVVVGEQDRPPQPCRQAHCEEFSRPNDIAQSPEYTTILNQSVPPGRYFVAANVVLSDTEDADPFPATARCTIFNGNEVVDSFALQMGESGSGAESVVFSLQGITTTTGGMTQLSLGCRKGSNDTTEISVRESPKLTAIEVGQDAFVSESADRPDDISQSPHYTTVLNESVPPGRYLVTANVVLSDEEDADPFPATARCTILSGNEVVDSIALQMGESGSGTESTSFSLYGIAAVSDDPSELSLMCRKGSNDTTQIRVRESPKLTAINVGQDAFVTESSDRPDDIAQSPNYTTVLNQTVQPGRYLVAANVVLSDDEDADPFPATASCTMISGDDVLDSYALQMGESGSGNESVAFPLHGIATISDHPAELSLMCRKGSNDTTQIRVRENPKLIAVSVGNDAFGEENRSTRLEIGEKWVSDMQELERSEGRTSTISLQLVPGVGHNPAGLTDEVQEIFRTLMEE